MGSSFNLLDLQNKNEIKGQNEEEIERKNQRYKKEEDNKNDQHRKQDRTEGLIPDHTTNFTPPFVNTYHDLLISTMANLENSSKLNYYIMKILFNCSYYFKNLSKHVSELFFTKIYNRDDNIFNFLIIENILQYQFDTNARFIFALLGKADDILTTSYRGLDASFRSDGSLETKLDKRIVDNNNNDQPDILTKSSSKNKKLHKITTSNSSSSNSSEEELRLNQQSPDHNNSSNITNELDVSDQTIQSIKNGVDFEQINPAIYRALKLLIPQVNKFKIGKEKVTEEELHEFLKNVTLVGLLPERKKMDFYDFKNEMEESNQWIYKFVRGQIRS